MNKKDAFAGLVDFKSTSQSLSPSPSPSKHPIKYSNPSTAPQTQQWNLDYLQPSYSHTHHQPQNNTPDLFDLDFLSNSTQRLAPELPQNTPQTSDLLNLGSCYNYSTQNTTASSKTSTSSPFSLDFKLQTTIDPTSNTPQPIVSPIYSPDIPPESPIANSDIDRLMAAGFGREESKLALEAANGLVEKAVDYLFENRNSVSAQNSINSHPETPSPLQDKISFWEAQKPNSQDKILSTASAFGMSMFKSAKSAFDYSKKKISEVVEKAQEKIKEKDSTSPKKWNFDDPGSLNSDYAPFKDSEFDSKHYTPSEKNKIITPKLNKSPTFDKLKPSIPTFTVNKLEFEPAKQMHLLKPQEAIKQSSAVNFYPVKNKNQPSLKQESFSDFSNISFANFASPKNVSVGSKKVSIVPPAVTASSLQIENSNSYKEKGNSFFKVGQYSEAESLYTQAIQCLPENHLLLVPLYNNRAGARLKTGAYTDAVNDCNIVQNLQAGELKSLLRRANAYEALEKWLEAQADYRAIMIQDSNVKSVSQGLARCSKALNQNSMNQNSTATSFGPVISSSEKVPSLAQKTSSSYIPAVKSFVNSDINSLAIPLDTNVKNSINTAVQQLRNKNQQLENEESTKLAYKDQVDDMITHWRKGKEDNLRALLSSLDAILWRELEWKSINLSELITSSQVKVKYMKAVAKVHPDKLASETSIKNKLIANSVFSTLNKAWDSFKNQNGLH